MNIPTKLGGYSLGLAAVFAAGLTLGQLNGPPAESGDGHGGHPASAAQESTSGPEAGTAGEESTVPGLTDTQGGYTFAPATTELPAGATRDFRFRILDRNGEAVTRYDEEHEKELHLIVASRDLTWFRHVHPVRGDSGSWSVPLELPEPGRYRAFADFTATGAEALTLGVDLTAPGEANPAPLPPVEETFEVDGYTVAISGTPTGTGEAEITVRVTRDGRPVEDLDPYLGAYGHLVALRAEDLGYLHVHPTGEPGDGSTRPGSEVSFVVALPRTGDHRLFFDFQHEGTVRTAAFTVSVPQRTDRASTPATSTSTSPPATDDPGSGHGDGH